MKKITLMALVAFSLAGCAELQSIASSSPQQQQQNKTQNTQLSNSDISMGLKQALEMGIASGVDMLGQQDGFYKNELVKILLPEQLQVVDRTLRNVGMGSLADQGIMLLNRAAEGAVVKAKPIFISAIKNLSFQDAASILTKSGPAATQYLRENTTKELAKAFAPEVQKSLSRVGADKVWNTIIGKYNSLPMVTEVNPDLTDYVTQKTVEGLFMQVEEKEKEIRQNVSARTTPLLKRVFEKAGK